jgi:hypothetical protein
MMEEILVINKPLFYMGNLFGNTSFEEMLMIGWIDQEMGKIEKIEGIMGNLMEILKI